MAERTLFGTDGVRGRANVDLTPELAMGLARAAGDGRRGVVVIGRDTRRSGQMLSDAIQAGFHSVGLDTIDLGIIPVGAVSWFTRDLKATYGVMISASHNPAPDNGIKFFGPDGEKLDDDREAAIEARFRHGAPWPEITGAEVGMRTSFPDPIGRYVEHLAGRTSYSFNGISVALDCSNGAASVAAPRLFEQLGAEVVVHAAEPSGMNINDGCGATKPAFLAERAEGRLGFAFDGDADRLIAVDEDGQTVNGDAVMAVLARHLHDRDELPGDLVVATVMSNLGFKLALQSLGLSMAQTAVGDRYVLEEMKATGAGLGGEQSGHVIFGGEATGDGLLTAVRLLEVIAATGRPLRELRRLMTELPQVLRNVPVRVKERLPDAEPVWAAVERLSRRLGDQGRILVRPSGTEQLVRVMVEATEQPEAAIIAEEIAGIVVTELGGIDPVTSS